MQLSFVEILPGDSERFVGMNEAIEILPGDSERFVGMNEAIETLPGDSERFVGMNEADDNKHRQSLFLSSQSNESEKSNLRQSSSPLKPRDEQAIYIYDDFNHVENVLLSILLLSWH